MVTTRSSMCNGTSIEESEKKWAALRRSSPDPGASVPATLSEQKLYLFLTSLVYYPLLLFFIPFWTLRWLLTPSFPLWTYPRMLANRQGKLYGLLNSFYLRPMDDEPSRWAGTASPPEIITPHGSEYTAARKKGEIEEEIIQLQPVDKKYRIGLAVGEWVKEEIIPGFWLIPRTAAGKGDEKAKDGEKVIMHIHGGGYTGGHPRWNTVPLDAVKAGNMRLLSVNYRKPLIPSQAFPAPLLDALSGYLHLTQDLGFSPQNITLLGKSAGGHLALMLSRYLHDLNLEQPGKLLFIAPWCDFKFQQASHSRNSRYDTLTVPSLKRAVRASMRYYKAEAIDDPYFNPVDAGVEGWKYLGESGTKVYMVVATRELFEDEVNIVARDMRAAGVNVTLRVDIDGTHTSIMWLEEPRKVLQRDFAEFLSK